MQIKCPGCSTKYTKINLRNTYYGCKNCGQHYSVDSGKYSKIHKYNKVQGKTLCPVEVGMMGRLNNKTYKVTSRIKYKSTYREYDDTKKDYSQKEWIYEQLNLYCNDCELLSLFYDEEGFSKSISIVPDAPKLPEQGNNFISFFKDYRESRIAEQGKANVIFVEGELNERFELNHKIYFTTYFHGNIGYTVESIQAGTNYITEINFYEETSANDKEILKAFASSPTIKKLFTNAWALNYLINSLFVASAMCFFLWVITSLNTNKPLFSHQLYFDVGDSIFRERGYYTPAFKLPEKGVYRFYWSANYNPDNTDLSFEVDLIDNKTKEIINNVDADFYQESGYDDEGHWTEREIEGSLFYKVSTPTEFFARIRMDNEMNNNGQNGEIFMTVYKDMILEYYAIGGLIFLFLALKMILVRNYALPGGSVPRLRGKQVEWLVYLMISILVVLGFIIIK